MGRIPAFWCSITARGILEDNDIFANYVGVVISMGGNPTLQRNRIHDGKSQGVLVEENSRGTLEDNDIFANFWGAWQSRRAATLPFRNSGEPDFKKRAQCDNDSQWWWRGFRR
jgi:parallel beta-helix repeat protein